MAEQLPLIPGPAEGTAVNRARKPVTIPDFPASVEVRTVSGRKIPVQVFVYVIQAASGLVKIGVSHDPERRLSTLQTGHPDELRLLGFVSGGRPLEAHLHRMLKAHRVRGEWFRPAPRVVEVVRLLCSLGERQSRERMLWVAAVLRGEAPPPSEAPPADPAVSESPEDEALQVKAQEVVRRLRRKAILKELRQPRSVPQWRATLRQRAADRRRGRQP